MGNLRPRLSLVETAGARCRRGGGLLGKVALLAAGAALGAATFMPRPRAWLKEHFMADAGATELTVGARQQVITPLGEICAAAALVRFDLAAYDPGVSLPLAGDTGGYAARREVGAYDYCVTPEQQQIAVDDRHLTVRLLSVSQRRPQVVHNFVDFDGNRIRTDWLRDSEGRPLADAAPSKTIGEFLHNLFSGSDRSYLADLGEIMDRYAEAVLAQESACHEEALDAVTAGMEDYYRPLAVAAGLELELDTASATILPPPVIDTQVGEEIDIVVSEETECVPADWGK